LRVAIFVGGEARFGFVPQHRVSSLVATLMTPHHWFLKGVQLYISASNREKCFSPKTSGLASFFLALLAERQRGNL